MKRLLLISVLCAPLLFGGCAKRIVDVTVTIYGTVTDKETGEPLSVAHVSIMPGDAGSKDTGSDGYFEFIDIPEDSYTITVTKVGYKSNLRHVNAVAGSRIQIAIPLERNN